MYLYDVDYYPVVQIKIVNLLFHLGWTQFIEQNQGCGLDPQHCCVLSTHIPFAIGGTEWKGRLNNKAMVQDIFPRCAVLCCLSHQSQNAILTLQVYNDVGADVVACQHGDSDAKVCL